MKTYCFDVEDAISYGVDESIMLYNIKHWICHNMANGRNTHDKKTWTYNSKKAFCKLFPFWSESQIKRILNSLLNQNVIITGNYNKSAYDRTLWYALSDETNLLSWIGRKRPMDDSKMTNQSARIDQPIPDINTDINKDTRSSDDDRFDQFWKTSPKKVGKKKARVAFNRLTTSNQDCAISDFSKRYSGTAKQFIPNPTTYIHGEGWHDEIITEEPTSNSPPKTHSASYKAFVPVEQGNVSHAGRDALKRILGR